MYRGAMGAFTRPPLTSGNWANLLCGFAEVEHELAGILPWLNRFHSGEMRNRLNGQQPDSLQCI